MSCCDRRLAVLGILAVSGCGFRPLYGGGLDGGGPASLFGAVAVSTSSDELGFRMRDSLVRSLRPARAGAPFLLNVSSEVERRGVVIEEDDEITRFNLRLTATYALTRVGASEDAPPLATGEVLSIAAFNANPSQFATLVSQREVLDRATRDAADKIVKKLATSYQPAWLG